MERLPTRHELFRLDELSPGTMRRVEVDGLDLIIARAADGGVHALRNFCSHFGAKLSDGRIYPLLDADDVGCPRPTGRTVVQCPWHGFEFELASGRSPSDPKGTRVRTYPVMVQDGIVVLER
jgi:nitrite reductase/ring-hydroxylating ferredoxin subunit